ncbi:diguanylate cyclase [Rhodoferax sp. 4810]|nr:GGDEF domain-containing protein [Thiospirillum jenense]MBB1075886.1 diguanylate cyclase [Rhodoferax jenense]
MNTIPSGDLLAVLDEALTSVIITTAELNADHPKILYVNKAFEKMTGYSRIELIGQTPRILQGPETDRATLDRLRRNLENGENFEGRAINYRKDGVPYWVSWNIVPIRDHAGNIIYWFSNQKDVTTEVQLHDALEQEQLFLTQAIDLNPTMIGISDGRELKRANAALRTFFQIDDLTHFQQQVGCICHYFRTVNGRPFVSHSDWVATLENEGPLKFTAELHGRLYYLLLEGRKLPAQSDCFIVSLHDITDAEIEHSRMLNEATHDPLTSLLNRRGLDMDMKTQGIYQQMRGFCVLLIDVDHFKRVNDTLGHDYGDQVLCHLAQQLLQVTRKSDLVARWGGEEFVIILPRTIVEEGIRVGENLRQAIEKSVMISTTVSIGVAHSSHYETLDEIIVQADKAMYQAKQQGRNRVIAAF